MKRISAIISFYRPFAISSSLITSFFLYLVYKNGLALFNFLLIYKIIFVCLVLIYYHTYRNIEFYYYKNLGISKMTLSMCALLLDISIFIFMTILIYNIR